MLFALHRGREEKKEEEKEGARAHRRRGGDAQLGSAARGPRQKKYYFAPRRSNESRFYELRFYEREKSRGREEKPRKSRGKARGRECL